MVPLVSYVGRGNLEFSPLFASLRNDPRFKELLNQARR
jgi:hypothetical protein